MSTPSHFTSTPGPSHARTPSHAHKPSGDPFVYPPNQPYTYTPSSGPRLRSSSSPWTNPLAFNSYFSPDILISPTFPALPRRRPARKKKSRWTMKLLYSILYQTTFYLFIIITAALLVGSAWGLGEQAWRTGDRRRWNIVLIVAAYLAIGFISVAHVWSRLLSIKKMIRTMPKPYMPTKNIDVPKRVADHIMVEYSRTAVIAHISQATKGQQEGWGRPGSKWENQHFRTYILNTLPTMTQALAPGTVAPPLSVEPLLNAANSIGDSGAIRLFVNSYAKLIDKARFSGQEPNESDAMACDKIVDVVLLTLEMKRRREGKEVPLEMETPPMG